MARKVLRRRTEATMVLIQLLLPVPQCGSEEARRPLTETERELNERFKGPGAYVRSPAQSADGETQTGVSDTAVVEVVTDSFDRAWWRAYARTLVDRFNPGHVRWRAVPIELQDQF